MRRWTCPALKMKKNLIDYELLWEKITDYVKATSRTTARPVLLLYYANETKKINDNILLILYDDAFINANREYKSKYETKGKIEL